MSNYYSKDNKEDGGKLKAISSLLLFKVRDKRNCEIESEYHCERIEFHKSKIEFHKKEARKLDSVIRKLEADIMWAKSQLDDIYMFADNNKQEKDQKDKYLSKKSNRDYSREKSKRPSERDRKDNDRHRREDERDRRESERYRKDEEKERKNDTIEGQDEIERRHGEIEGKDNEIEGKRIEREGRSNEREKRDYERARWEGREVERQPENGNPDLKLENDGSHAKKTIMVMNLSYKVTEHEIKQHFEVLGCIKVSMSYDERKVFRGYAFAKFCTEEKAQEALNRDGTEFQGRLIIVKWAKTEMNS